jgi:hypothetical protein
MFTRMVVAFSLRNVHDSLNSLVLLQMTSRDASKTVYILCMDGGGVRGIVTARVLQELQSALQAELRSKKSLADSFHLIAGTSTGGVLASGLFAGISVDEIVELYNEKKAGEVFDSKYHHWTTTSVLLDKPTWEATGLEHQLAQAFGTKTLYGEKSNTELLVASYQMSKLRPALFRSWKRRRTLASGKKSRRLRLEVQDPSTRTTICAMSAELRRPPRTSRSLPSRLHPTTKPKEPPLARQRSLSTVASSQTTRPSSQAALPLCRPLRRVVSRHGSLQAETSFNEEQRRHSGLDC